MILIIDLCYKKNSLSRLEFVKPINNLVEKMDQTRIKHYKEVTDDDLHQSDKVIMCGTALKDNEVTSDLKYFKWLQNYDKPVLGICAGMQTIAHFFGSNIVKRKEIGITKIIKLMDNSLIEDDIEIYALHSRCVTDNNEFFELAKSDDCIHAIKHKRKPIYGVLFHPEVRNKKIINRFLMIKNIN